MKFYDRVPELKFLDEIRNESMKCSKMTVMVGRRRIGKTRLLLKAYENTDCLYFFIAKKEESLLCKEFTEEIQNKLGIEIFGEISKFKDLFSLLMNASKKKPITLIIDEFQVFNKTNNSIYSEMQDIWDRKKNDSKLNLILCGSIYSLMNKIFENSKEPLFGRADEKIHLKPFDVDVLKAILMDNYPEYSPKDLLAFYIFTGGVAKYVEILMDKKAFSLTKILNLIFREHSVFLEERKNVLIEEFGKEYTTYFSILSLISSSKTSRVEIESILEKDTGGYLNRLENEYGVISRVTPIFAKPSGRAQKYSINDNFLNFWFRFIYKYRSAVEIGNYDYMKSIVKRDFDTFSGRFLERYFIEKLSLSNQFSAIGTHWEKGNKNEIDIVAINEKNKKVLFAEVKLNKEKISLPILMEKSKNLLKELSGYKAEYRMLSFEDM